MQDIQKIDEIAVKAAQIKALTDEHQMIITSAPYSGQFERITAIQARIAELDQQKEKLFLAS